MTPPVPFLDVGATYLELRQELDAAYHRVMDSGWYLLGAELEAFEREFAEYVGASYGIGVASGLDALVLALRVLDVGHGDEVIVPSHTYIATWLAVTAVGATIVPVEPDPFTNNVTAEGISAAITSRTAVILPVHLYGLPADVIQIENVAKRYGIPVLYDAAQAHGSRVNGLPVGSFGALSAWSFYPGKNLGAFADGGAVTTDDPDLASRLRRLRNYGSEVKYRHVEKAVNSRLDELQASMLRVKLRHLDEWNDRRRKIAGEYMRALNGCGLQLPIEPVGLESAWHLFVVQTDARDGLQERLARTGIQTLIHYPIAPHRQEAYADLELRSLPIAESLARRALSLPLGPHLQADEVGRVVSSIRENSAQM